MLPTELKNEIIESVSTSTMSYINRQWGMWFYVPGIALSILAIYGAYYFPDAEIISLPLIWFLLGMHMRTRKF